MSDVQPLSMHHPSPTLAKFASGVLKFAHKFVCSMEFASPISFFYDLQSLEMSNFSAPETPHFFIVVLFFGYLAAHF